MVDWRALVRQRIADDRLDPAAEIDIVEELAQHVEDRYDELRRAGMDEHEATRMSLQELDGAALVNDLLETLPKVKAGRDLL
jgi:putative ABC transport system permease protein